MSNNPSSQLKEAEKQSNKKEQKQEPETITIPKKEYDDLNNTIKSLIEKLGSTKFQLHKINGALIQIQATVYNTNNSI